MGVFPYSNSMFFSKYYKAEQQRNWPIDFLRGIVVCMGASGHFYFIMSYFGAETLPWTHFSAILAYNIPYGIAVFSPVSGYLITSMLLKQTEGELANVHVPQFYLLRFFRIMPGLILLCVMNLLLLSVSYPGFQIDSFSWQTILFHIFTFRTNVLFPTQAHHLWPWSILWSLSIEEVFYLFFPLICVVLRTHKKVIFLLIALIFYGPYCRLHANSGFSSIRLYFGCFDLIALGCLAAILSKTGMLFTDSTQARSFRPKLWIGSGIFLMISMYFAGPWITNNVCGPTLIGLGVFMYLIGVTYTKKNSQLSHSDSSTFKALCKRLLFPFIVPVCILGMLSYELYLFHVLIFLLFKPYITWIGAKIGWTWFFANTCLCLMMALCCLLGGLWFFHCINPLRKKFMLGFGEKLDFLTFIHIPRFVSPIQYLSPL